MVEQVARRAHEFDIIHFHLTQLHLPVARRLPGVAHVTTMHGRLDLGEVGPLFREFAEAPVVSISDAQRHPLPHARWVGTVHHGLPPDLLPFRAEQGDYLAFLGRVSPEKGLDRAISIAKACGCRLRVAAKVDPADRKYFEHEIAPLLDHPLVEFVGEIGERDKGAFLGGARALLFPIDWPEPFGLVMIEALACGLPVVAFEGGSVREVIDDGVTGCIVRTVPEAIEAVKWIAAIDRRACRAAFERRFTAARMASEYLKVYRLLQSEARARRPLAASHLPVQPGAGAGAWPGLQRRPLAASQPGNGRLGVDGEARHGDGRGASTIARPAFKPGEGGTNPAVAPQGFKASESG
jgi:glycosyltransferase involved in cell wall biosynthesis